MGNTPFYMTIGNLIYLRDQADSNGNHEQAERFQKMIESERARQGNKPNYSHETAFKTFEMNKIYSTEAILSDSKREKQ